MRTNLSVGNSRSEHFVEFFERMRFRLWDAEVGPDSCSEARSEPNEGDFRSKVALAFVGYIRSFISTISEIEARRE